MERKTISAADLPAIGQPLAGGTFFAKHFVGDQLFALVFLDQSAEFTSAWGKYGKEVEGADSYVDGLANTEAMLRAECAAALKLNREAGDYIPSYVEHALLLAYAKANPGSDLKGWHWGSTQRSAYDAFSMDFDAGYQLSSVKNLGLRVRPVRRLLIQYSFISKHH